MALMREFTIRGGGTFRRRIATSCIIEMPAPAVLAVIQRPIGTIDRITMNMMSAPTPPKIVRICAASIVSPFASLLDGRYDDARALHRHHADRTARFHKLPVGDDIEA